MVFTLVWICSAFCTLTWASPRGLYLGVESGRFSLALFGKWQEAPPPTHWFMYSHSPRLNWWFASESRGEWWYGWAPIWLLALPAAALYAGLSWRDRIAVRRRLARLCRRCGYDLSATRHGMPCPECGSSNALTGHGVG